jgi:hypothetical protein
MTFLFQPVLETYKNNFFLMIQCSIFYHVLESFCRSFETPCISSENENRKKNKEYEMIVFNAEQFSRLSSITGTGTGSKI